MAELADALDLGSSGETCESSSLSFRTILILFALELRAADRCSPVLLVHSGHDWICVLPESQRRLVYINQVLGNEV